MLELAVCIYIICGYQTSRHRVIWHKTLLGKRSPCLVDVVYQCIVVLCFISWGTGCQCILVRLTEQKLVVTMAEQDLKKYCMRPHVTTMDHTCDFLLQYVHNGCERLTTSCERLTACLQSTCRVHMRALQSEGKFILIYSYFDIKVNFHIYYNMALGFKSLGLVMVPF